MKQKVIIIGHGYTSRLGIIRALGMAGHEVVVVVIMLNKRNGKPDTTKPIDCYSKYVSQVYYCLPNREQLIDLLLDRFADADQKVILFPDSDFSAEAIDVYQEKLKDSFLFPHINHIPGAIDTWMNKIRQKDMASKVGLNVARGVVVDVIDGEYTLPPGISYPCFPKPLITIVGAKTGLGRCDSENELRHSIGLLIKRSPSISVLVEEYIPIDQEYALVGLSDGQSTYIPGIISITEMASGSHFGVARRGYIEPVGKYEILINGFKRFVQEIGFCGVFDIDFYESRGVFYFCEMNFRYGGSGYAYTKLNVNFPDLFVRTITKASLPEELPLISNRAVFINERMCLDDWSKGYISTSRFLSYLRHHDISFISDQDDKGPERRFRVVLVKETMKRIIKCCFGELKRVY